MSNSTCANCGARMSCGCQRRTAVNGASACSGCVDALNAKINATNAVANPTSIKPVWGANRYKK
jgi:hypothetical protein